MDKHGLTVEHRQGVDGDAPIQPGDNAQLQAAYAEFLQGHPDFAETTHIDTLRAREYARLDEQGQVYLDFTGGGLYADCQLREHMEMLSRNVFGNPHSANPTSLAMTHLVDN